MNGPRRRPSNRQRVEDYYGVHETGIGARPAPAPADPAVPPAPPTVPPAPAGTPPQGPVPPAQGQVPPAARRPRVIPPPEVQVAAQEAARAAAGAPPLAPGSPSVQPAAAPSAPRPGRPAPEAGRSKPDPLTDPLTSETFQGVQPASDTYEAGVVGDIGYSAPTGPQAPPSTSATGFDGGFDQFAPPRFEPRAESRAEDAWADAAPQAGPQAGHEDGQTFEATFEAHPESETLDEPDESYIDVEVVDVEVDAAHVAETGESEDTAAVEVDEATGVDEAAEADEAVKLDEADESADADEAAEAKEQARPTFAEPLAIDPYPYTQIDDSYVDPETLQHLQNRQAQYEAKDPGDMTEFNESLNEAMAIDGALGVALVDASSGMALATAGNPAEFNLEVAAAGNSALVQAMSRTLGDLDLDDHIEDILITLGTQYQIVRPINQGTDDLFLYLVLDRSRANLAMARFRLTKLAEQIEV